MADVKISALTAAGSAAGTNEIPINEAGTTKKVTVTQIITAAMASPTIVTPTIQQPTLSAGSSSLVAATLSSGALKTAAIAGGVEYDGKAFYTSPLASARGVSPSTMFAMIQGSGFALGTGTSLQSCFPTSSDVWTLAASTAYWVEGMYCITKSGTTCTCGIGFTVGGSLTMNQFLLYCIGHVGAVNTAVTAQGASLFSGGSGTATTVIGATSSTNFQCYFSGICLVNVGGTLTPGVILSAASTSPTMAVGSFIRFTPIGANSVVSCGNVG